MSGEDMRGIALRLRGLRVRAGAARILDGLDLDVPHGALLGLMGPMGCGKSTLLKCLAGAAQPGLSIDWEEMRRDGPPPLLIGQRIRETGTGPAASRALAQMRIAALEGGACVETRDRNALLCIDEPTAGLTPEDGALVMQALRARSLRAPVIVVSHNAREVAAHCTHAALCGGGRILAQLPAEAFFGPDAGPETTHFLRTGGLPLARPGTPRGHLAPELRPTPEGIDTDPAAPGATLVPVLPGRLALAPDGGTAAAAAGMSLLRIEAGAAALLSPDGASTRLTWPDAARPAEGGAGPALALCRAVAARLARGERIALVPGAQDDGAAALLGGLLILQGIGPEEAGRIARLKMPGHVFRLGLEALWWDIDLALAMEAPQDAEAAAAG